MSAPGGFAGDATGDAAGERLSPEQTPPAGTGSLDQSGEQAARRQPDDRGLASAWLLGQSDRFDDGPAGSTGDDHYGPAGAGPARDGDGLAAVHDPHALLDDDERQRTTTRWKEIQADFVDDPRRAVEQADALVADLMQRLAAMFARERAGLEREWAGGDEASTEELRQSLRRYRSFFERLLAA